MNGSFFIHFAISSFFSSVVILFILIAKKMLKKHISSRWQYNMDYLFLILLAVPFMPGRFLNFLNPSNWMNLLTTGQNTVENASGLIDEGAQALYGTGWLKDFSVSVNRSTPPYLPTVFMGIWIAGIAVFLLFTLLCNRNLRLITESAKPVQNSEMRFLFACCKEELGVKKNIRFGTSILVKTPITVGFFKPYIILPPQKMSIHDMRYVLLHELTHCKHRDILVNTILCFFQIVHWFNPVVYFIFREIRLDREMACDASVLKLLPEKFRLEYGKTLLSFVSILTRFSALSFATDMGGSKPQIAKRLKSIVFYTGESRRLKVKSICVFLFAGLLMLSQIPAISALAAYDDNRYYFQADHIRYEDLSSYFGEFEGSFVLYDPEADLYTIHNKDRSVTRVSPDSTFKIYSGLIALETGVIDAGHSLRKWDGSAYPYEAWNQDQTLLSAMQNSVSWYFQQTDAQVGLQVLSSYFTRLSYGNYDLSGGLERYWMESSLRISPVEQVKLLTDFCQNKTLFSTTHVEAMKNILKLSEKNGAVLSGKTGTGAVNGKAVNGWFVGYVEKNGKTFIFATNIQGSDKAGGSAAVQITQLILKDKGIY